MGEQEILLDVDELGVATVTLNRPSKLNALTTNMMYHLLPRIARELTEDERVRVVIITGAGDGFCSGGDVSERLRALAQGEARLGGKDGQQPAAGFVLPLSRISKPVIVAVNGMAAGGGLSMALVSDFRIASERATFTAVFARRGLMPDGGLTSTLTRLVGLPKALELLLLAETIDAAEALRIGLVNQVVPHDQLMPQTRKLAEKLAKGPSIALQFTKRAVHHSLASTFEEQLYFESWGQNVCLSTRDYQEGVKAFLEKRDPKFTGE